MPRPRPILILAGGGGGLPTLEAVARRLPGREIHYVADLARGPFAHGSPEVLADHAEQLVRHFARLAPELVLLASHTLSAACLGPLRERLGHVAVAGLTEPAARAAAAAAGATHKPMIGVLASPTAVASRAIQSAIGRRRSRAVVLLQPVPLLGPLVEEGRVPADPMLRACLKQYLKPMMTRRPDVVLLAGGHLPRVAAAVQARVDEAVLLVGRLIDALRMITVTLNGFILFEQRGNLTLSRSTQESFEVILEALMVAVEHIRDRP